MDPILHTIIAVAALVLSYYLGHRRGVLESSVSFIEWIQEKIGMEEWDKWVIDIKRRADAEKK